MRIFNIIYIIILFSQIAICQSKDIISFTFNNTPLAEALIELESSTDYDFYFDESWLKEVNVTKAFDNETLEEVLRGLLIETSINYFIIDSKVILTKNNIIRDQLPEDYFKKKNASKIVVQTSKIPVLQKQYTNSFSNREGKIFTIGKEDKDSSQKKFKISGKISDVQTKEPIKDLTVFIRGTSINTVTDENGDYSLLVDKGYRILEISSLNYGKSQKQIFIYGNGFLNFNLNEEINQLKEVVVTSNKNRNVKSVEVGVTVIDIQGVKNIPLVLGERDFLKVATTMPGIKTAGEGTLGYSVRGGKVDQNLILFDDAALYNPSHFFGIFSAINPFATGNVNIYKGSIPSEFGGKLSSVIDISTKEINKKEFSGEASIGPVTGNLLIETPIIKDKSALLVGVRATYSNWVLRSISDESFQNTKASFYDALVKYEHIINKKNTMQATGYYSNDSYSITSDSIFDYGNRLGSLKWNHTFNDKNLASLQLVTSQYKFNIVYDGKFNRNFDFGYKINETQLKLKVNYLHSKKHKFLYGVSGKLYAINPGEIKPLGGESIVSNKLVDKEKGIEAAMFIADLYKVNKKLSLDIGLRYSTYSALGPSTQNIYATHTPVTIESFIETKEYDDNEFIKTYGGPELRFSARYFLSENASIKASYNNTIQYSHLLSSNTTASPIDSWKLSDLNIEPQRAQQYSLGLFKNSKDGIYEYSLEGYYKKMNNLLDYKVGAELLLNQNIETELLQGDGKAYGVEFLVKKQEGRFNGWFAYSYSKTLVKLDSEFFTNKVNNGDYFDANQDRPHNLNIVSNYRLTKRYSFSMNFNYQSGRPITYPTGKYFFNGSEQVTYSDRNKFRIPDYYRLDLGVNIEGNHKNVKLAHSFWNISVYNVLGRNNPFSVFFVTENGQVKGYKSSIFTIPVPSITYNFKF